MADYVVNLQGRDNLTPTLKNVKDALNGMSSTATGLEKIQEKFEKIDNSSQPLKRKLAQIKNLMAQLNINGDANSPLYNQMAQAAGSYADALADASAATKRFASDTMTLDAGIAAFQGLAAAGSIATGVMGLFGTKNEEVERAILKVQSAMAILNGVQSIANILNKDSVLVQKLKQISLAVTTAATSKDTAALGANTTAQVLNTGATKKDTIAMQAWNTVKAVSKALLGDFTGLLIVGAGALATYAIATSDTTDEIEKQNAAATKQKEIHDQYLSSYANSAATLMSKYRDLQKEWANLRTEHEKMQFLKDSKARIDELGESINTVSDAERFFKNDTTNVIKSFDARAKAAAAAAAKVKIFAEWMEKANIRTLENGGTYQKLTQNITTTSNGVPSEWTQAGLIQGIDYTAEWAGGQSGMGHYRMTDSGRNKVNQYRERQAQSKWGNYQKGLEQQRDKDLQYYDKMMDDAIAEGKNASRGSSSNTHSSSNHSTSHNTSSNSSVDTKPKTDLDIYGEYESAMRNVQRKMDLNIITQTKAEEEAKTLTDAIKNKLGKDIVTVPLKYKTDKEIYDEIVKSFKNVEDKFNYGLATKEEYEKAAQEANDALEKKFGKDVKKVEVKIEPVIDKGSLADIEQQMTSLLNELNNLNPVAHAEEYKNKYAQIVELAKQKLELEKKSMIGSKASIAKDEVPEFFAKGSEIDKILSYNNAIANIDDIITNVKLIGYDESKKRIEEMIKLVKELTGIEIEVEFNDKDGTIIRGEETLKGLKGTVQSVGGIVGNTAAAFSGMAKAIGEASDNEGMAKTALIAQAVGQLALSFASSLKTCTTWYEWVAAGLAGGATLASLVAQLNSFAGGGIVSGGSLHGDQMLARVNSGEMILNGRQQDNLFNAIDNNRLGGNNLAGKVEFEIDGRVIKGVLNNYDSKMKKIK